MSFCLLPDEGSLMVLVSSVEFYWILVGCGRTWSRCVSLRFFSIVLFTDWNGGANVMEFISLECKQPSESVEQVIGCTKWLVCEMNFEPYVIKHFFKRKKKPQPLETRGFALQPMQTH